MKLTKEQIKFLDKVCNGRQYWILNPEGKVDVNGGVNMCGMGLTEMPVKFGYVDGSFYCSRNNLTTLKNCPVEIGYDFWFTDNNLTDYFKNIKEEDFKLWDNLDWYDTLQEYPFLINIAKKYLSSDVLDAVLCRTPQTKEFYIDDKIVIDDRSQLTKKQIKFLDMVCLGKWTLNSDGGVDVDGDVTMSGMNLTEIPVKFGRVEGCFGCSDNNLTTLKNCPDFISGNFYCYDNPLTDYFKNLKEEDFPCWDRLKWGWMLEEYPFLVNIGKKHCHISDWENYLNKYPQTKEYLKDETENVQSNISNSIKIENGILTLNINQNKIEFQLTEKTNFNLNF